MNFFVGDQESLRKRALADAARVARENAEILAREAGCQASESAQGELRVGRGAVPPDAQHGL